MSSPGDWWASLPPFTRIYGAACFGTTLAFQLGLHNFGKFVLDFGRVWDKFEIWRLLTNFVVIGPFGIPFVMQLFFIIRYMVPLEQKNFEHRADDFIFMQMFGATTLVLIAFFLPQFLSGVCSFSFIFMNLYVWARLNSNVKVNLYGIIKIDAFFMPWVLVALTALMGGSPIKDLVGIAVGHLYYFLVHLHPQAGGYNYLATPDWCKRFVGWTGLAAVDPAYMPDPTERRPFQGRARRLNDYNCRWLIGP
eukprot:jgi/Mesvir1/12146/Mv00398-RA.1